MNFKKDFTNDNDDLKTFIHQFYIEPSFIMTVETVHYWTMEILKVIQYYLQSKPESSNTSPYQKGIQEISKVLRHTHSKLERIYYHYYLHPTLQSTVYPF